MTLHAYLHDFLNLFQIIWFISNSYKFIEPILILFEHMHTAALPHAPALLDGVPHTAVRTARRQNTAAHTAAHTAGQPHIAAYTAAYRRTGAHCLN
jgi:hypothetical protein